MSANRRQRRAAGLTKRIIEELAIRAETDGCEQCGHRFGEYVRYVIAALPAAGFTVRCDRCLANVTPILAGVCFGSGDPWVEDDRAWFLAHPTRRWRLRELIPGEAEWDVPAGYRPAVAVYQIAPGKRMRHAVCVCTNDPLDSFTDRGIVTLVPGVAEAAAKIAATSDEEMKQMRRDVLAARLAVLAQEMATL